MSLPNGLERTRAALADRWVADGVESVEFVESGNPREPWVIVARHKEPTLALQSKLQVSAGSDFPVQVQPITG